LYKMKTPCALRRMTIFSLVLITCDERV
jgi:hypothetical protein